MQKQELAQQTGWSDDLTNIAQPSTNWSEQSTDTFTTSENSDSQKADNSQENPLLDAEDKIAPGQINAERSISHHPVPRVLLTLGGVSFLTFIGYCLVNGTGFNQTQQAQVVDTPTPELPKQQVNGDRETGQMQAKLATIKQQQQLDALKNAKVNPQQPASTPSVQVTKSPTVPPPPIVSRPAPIIPVRNVPPPIVSSRPASIIPVRNVAPPIVSRPAPIIPVRNVPPPPPSVTRPASVIPASTPIDPMQQWLMAANAGSYGGVSPVLRQRTQNAAANQTNDYQVAVATNSALDSPNGGIGISDYQKSDSSRGRYQTVGYVPNTLSLVVGTRASGKLETPIAWSGEIQQAPNQNFLIQLTEPLKGANNSTFIPKGAYLVAQVSDATNTGLLQMSVVSIITNQNGQATERSVPNGSLMVLGKGGNPLRAKAQGRGTSSTLATSVLSGLGSAAGLINQPTSQSVFSSGGGFQTTTTNRDPNYLAGFGQGVAQSLVQQMQQRNQLALQHSESERVFVLEQGTSVQVFVNQSVSL